MSRIEDERETGFVYETRAHSEVTTHIYGIADWQPPTELEVITHGGHDAAFSDAWFAVFKRGADGEIEIESVSDGSAA